ncbi:MAG: histone deacetylase [Bryobacteraceae bacterium]|nr:histone deacetylase [Bryobacteraceae bacterium]MDW8379004.1 histone deacetylase [Bryobacterales bacterium]
MPKIALVYHDGYDLQFGDHIFPSVKYRLIRETLVEEGLATPDSFYTPEPVSDEDLMLVHSEDWIKKLKQGTLNYGEILKLEIPYSRRIVHAFWLAAGGSILAARLALKQGVGFNIGGGFHHAFREHGEGFCAINDVAVAARKMIQEKTVERVMIVDCDVHHGNGTAAIFQGDPQVFTFSIHQFNNYPDVKPPSTLDVHLPDGVGDEEYLARLGQALIPALHQFQPNLLFYIAGADPYLEDQLGGLNLTLEGLKQRDRLVIQTAIDSGVPVAVTLAGGYALKLEDTVRIHSNTAWVAEDVLRRSNWDPR